VRDSSLHISRSRSFKHLPAVQFVIIVSFSILPIKNSVQMCWILSQDSTPLQRTFILYFICIIMTVSIFCIFHVESDTVIHVSNRGNVGLLFDEIIILENKIFGRHGGT